jgi:hypothetical protein
MAYDYSLKFKTLTTQYDGANEEVTSFTVELKNAAVAVSGLDAASFVISDGTNPIASTTYTVAADAPNFTWTITMNSGSELATTSYLIVQVNDTTNSKKSNPLFLDLAQTYSSNVANYNIGSVDKAGTYTLTLDTVNGEALDGPVTQSNITIGPAPNAANSKVQLKGAYLTHFTTDKLSAKVTLDNGSTDFLDNGIYQVSVYLA